MPKHIYEQQEDISQFQDPEPVTLTPYTVKDYDSLGNWVLYERREDWKPLTLAQLKAKSLLPSTFCSRCWAMPTPSR